MIREKSSAKQEKMKIPTKAKAVLKQILQIRRMERGTLSKMAGRPQYNHQTWQNGRNCVRYVPTDQVASVQEAIEGYKQFMSLVQQYADIMIAQTRKERNQEHPDNKQQKRGRKKTI